MDGFAGFVHGLDLVLEPARGDERAHFVVGTDVNCSARRDRGINVFDPGGVAFASNPQDTVANTDIAIADGEITAGIEAQSDVI